MASSALEADEVLHRRAERPTQTLCMDPLGIWTRCFPSLLLIICQYFKHNKGETFSDHITPVLTYAKFRFDAFLFACITSHSDTV